MVGTLADKISGLFDPRFRLTVWLPTVVFAVATGGVAVLGVGWAKSVSWWRSAGTEGQVALAILAFSGVTLLAFLISARLMSFAQFFEGYWDELPFGQRLANRRKAHYRARLVVLAAAASKDDAEGQRAQAKMYYWYPPADTPDEVMPTRVGNVLACASENSSRRCIRGNRSVGWALHASNCRARGTHRQFRGRSAPRPKAPREHGSCRARAGWGTLPCDSAARTGGRRVRALSSRFSCRFL